MAIFVDSLKLKATVRSMHQFCGVVRAIFPSPPSDDVVEAATLYIYIRSAEGIFGKRFSERMSEALRDQLKFASPVDIETRLLRIDRNRDAFETAANEADPPESAHDSFTNHVHSVIRALVSEANFSAEDPGIVRLLFPRFEHAARRVRDHLLGIKEQSRFVMR